MRRGVVFDTPGAAADRAEARAASRAMPGSRTHPCEARFCTREGAFGYRPPGWTALRAKVPPRWLCHEHARQRDAREVRRAAEREAEAAVEYEIDVVAGLGEEAA